MTATLSVYVDAPVEEVFGFFRDPGNWQGAGRGVVFRDVHLTPEGTGTFYTWTTRMAGVPVEGFDVFTEFVPDQRVTDRSSRSFVGTWTYTFDQEGSGTRLTHQRHPASSRARRAIDRLMDRFRVSVERQELEKLKVVLEEPAAPGAERAASGRQSER